MMKLFVGNNLKSKFHPSNVLNLQELSSKQTENRLTTVKQVRVGMNKC